jgi:hypothetical protein
MFYVMCVCHMNGGTRDENNGFCFEFTVAHVLAFFVFTGLLLVKDLNTETSVSNHYEVFLLFRLQSLCTLLS